MFQQWGYSTANGPSTWCKHYPAAGGERQSPVDIKTSVAVQDNVLPNLVRKYVPENVKKVENTGCGWKVTIDGQGSELSGGPLEGKYSIEQFHCHWGDSDEQGSEHTVDGRAYAAELHLVHANLTKYGSVAEAVQHPDGLCVLGVFLTPGKEHPEIDKIISKLSSIRYKNMRVDAGIAIDLANFIPKSSAYWTYQGSLTTPPCNECVIWIVFQEPIEVSREQLKMLRKSVSCCLQGSCKCKMGECNVYNNYRPTVPIGQRIVKKCNQ